MKHGEQATLPSEPLFVPRPRRVTPSPHAPLAPPVGAPRFAGADAERAAALYDRLASATAADGRIAARRLGKAGNGAASVLVTCRRTSDPALAHDPVSRVRHDEGYRLRIAEGEADLEYTSRRGLRNGVATVAAIVAAGRWRPGLEIEDAPRFAVRGLIEGYYGPPWSPASRREMLRVAAAHKMNAYFYGPKDDPYHRSEWRASYPDDRRRELAGLVAAADELAMDFWYTVGPGLSMAYHDEADNGRLAAKLREVASLGVSGFGLLFDDIPGELQHDADRASFGSLASAHATVANRLYDSLRADDARSRLVVCPTQYWGAGDEPYIDELGELLDPRIEVFWTGPEICSRELSLRDAALLERTLSRPALYWDNYPVNDLEMRHELHVGPYRGRDPHLYRASLGVVANGMQYPEATKIGLITIADYLWNPEGYEPESSWREAIRSVVGLKDAEDFAPFADCNRYSALYTTDAPALATGLGRAGFLRETGREDEAREVLGETVARLRRACALFDRGMENETLQAELRPWIAKFRKGVALLDRLHEDLGRSDPDWSEFSVLADAYERDPFYTFADVLYGVIEEFGQGKR